MQIEQKPSDFLYDELRVLNTEYLIKKKLGKSTYSTTKYFSCIEEKEDKIMIPRGCWKSLIHFCEERNIPYQIENLIPPYPEINFPTKITLHPHQYECIKSAYDKKVE